MASEIIVQTLKGPTSGANANKVIIPSGQTLDIDAWTPPAGTVLQVFHQIYDTQVDRSSTTRIASGLTVDITPSSTSNKILIIVNHNGLLKQTSDVYMQSFLVRDIGGTVVDLDKFTDGALYTANTSSIGIGGTGFTYYDSPSTTSQCTYYVEFKASSNNDVVRAQVNGAASSICAMEIAG